ncbi:FAD-dependent oxidoreductase [Palleronia sp. LCG004]|uniref:hydroxysqualene dehydroxylase n=1 Tax=Palleronia sp. LCG004 TaxID=3079304 RepID=UPI0029420F57|nr:FAD-dependent oxidoreductase [Palleronia sp. LCG004]WOI57749.1 FAD-dependent oxidoreductase [Palleronia sp. LCG004]
MRQIHIVGAGLAGLACAARLSEDPGLRITLWEATRRAGGRCWSFHDSALDRVIDNGNHLILSGNAAVLDHARRIGASDRLSIAEDAALPFVDLADGRRWIVRIPDGIGAFWRHGTRLPGGTGRVALDILRLLRAGPGRSVGETIPGRGPGWRAFWEPLTLAVLNEPPERGSALLLARVLRETVLKGAGASRPVLAPEGLGPALVDPALALLERRGARLRWGAPLRGVESAEGKITALSFGSESVPLAHDDAVVLASADAMERVIDGARPAPGQTILNAHFRIAPDKARDLPSIMGVVGARTQWIFCRDDVVSVTVSAAESSGAAGMANEALLDALWPDVRRALDLGGAPPLARRLIRAKSATWDQSADAVARRHSPESRFSNLALAGDHLATGLPCSIEAAIRSGLDAARRIADRN